MPEEEAHVETKEKKRDLRGASVRAWITIIVSVTGGTLGLLGFLRAEKVADTHRQIEVEDALDEAFDLMNERGEGEKAATIIQMRPRRGPKPRSDLEEARRLIVKAQRLDPKNARAMHLMGHYHTLMGEPEKALAHIDRAIARQIENPLIQNARGLALQQLGRTDEAIASYEKAVEQTGGKHPIPYNNLGLALQQKGRFDEAKQAYEMSLQLDGDYVHALNNMGLLLMKMDDKAGARDYLERAIALKPNYALAHTNLAELLRDEPPPERAFALCEQALRLDPYLAPAHYVMGLLHMDSGALDEAVESFNQATRWAPHFANAHAGLADALEARGDAEGAKEHRAKAEELRKTGN